MDAARVKLPDLSVLDYLESFTAEIVGHPQIVIAGKKKYFDTGGYLFHEFLHQRFVVRKNAARENETELENITQKIKRVTRSDNTQEKAGKQLLSHGFVWSGVEVGEKKESFHQAKSLLR